MFEFYLIMPIIVAIVILYWSLIFNMLASIKLPAPERLVPHPVQVDFDGLIIIKPADGSDSLLPDDYFQPISLTCVPLDAIIVQAHTMTYESLGESL